MKAYERLSVAGKTSRGETELPPPEMQLDELEDRVDRLRALYDQYFMGIERLEPLILRKDVDRRIWQLRREQIRNTALRFRVQSVIQRYNTYEQYWQRICREIESGTYQRDISRAAARFGDVALTAMGRKRQEMFQKGAVRRAERDAQRAAASPSPVENPAPGAGAPAPAAGAPVVAPALPGRGSVHEAHPSILELDVTEVLVDLGDDEELELIEPVSPADGAPNGESVAPRTPPPVHRAARKAEPVKDPHDLPLSRLREIYGEYVQAKRRCRESTASVTFDGLAASLREKARQYRARYPNRVVDFKVTVEHGGAVLTPVVKG